MSGDQSRASAVILDVDTDHIAGFFAGQQIIQISNILRLSDAAGFLALGRLPVHILHFVLSRFITGTIIPVTERQFILTEAVRAEAKAADGCFGRTGSGRA